MYKCIVPGRVCETHRGWCPSPERVYGSSRPARRGVVAVACDFRVMTRSSRGNNRKRHYNIIACVFTATRRQQNIVYTKKWLNMISLPTIKRGALAHHLMMPNFTIINHTIYNIINLISLASTCEFFRHISISIEILHFNLHVNLCGYNVTNVHIFSLAVASFQIVPV